jgi:protein-disulfide isomerase
MPFKKSKVSFSSAVTIVIIALILSVPVNYFAQQYLQQIDSNHNKASHYSVGVEDKIAKYIENNGSKLLSSIEKSFQQQQQQQLSNRNDNILSVKANLYADTVPSIGKKNAKHRLVEFYDYNCGFCKKALIELQKITDDKNIDVEIFFIDFPILGKASELKAKASIAGHLLDRKKYLDLHIKLMKSSARTLPAVINLAVQSGYNKGKFTKEISSSKVQGLLQENRALAKKLYIQGTPAFILNDKFVDGALSYETLKTLIAQ